MFLSKHICWGLSWVSNEMQNFEADTENAVGRVAVHNRSTSTPSTVGHLGGWPRLLGRGHAPLCLGDAEYYGRYLLHIVLHLQQLKRISLYLLPLVQVVVYEVFLLTMLHLRLANHFWNLIVELSVEMFGMQDFKDTPVLPQHIEMWPENRKWEVLTSLIKPVADKLFLII